MTSQPRPAATRFRADGWPLCPACDEDELADLTHNFARRDTRLYCYRCGWRGLVDLTGAPTLGYPHTEQEPGTNPTALTHRQVAPGVWIRNDAVKRERGTEQA